jgi:hypothetical protein
MSVKTRASPIWEYSTETAAPAGQSNVCRLLDILTAAHQSANCKCLNISCVYSYITKVRRTHKQSLTIYIQMLMLLDKD